MWKPTASCIWNSFRSSGKRHLILTGNRGSGKTTLLSQLLPQALPGITTAVLPGKAVYLTDQLTKETAVIGIYDPTLPGTENKMRPCAEGFARLGVPALRRCAASGSDWIRIDEIGYLEAEQSRFLSALEALMACKQVAAAVRKQQLPFLQRLCAREDVFLVDLDAPYGSLGCVIMASGLGTRFGGNKLMAPFRDQPLILRALQATEGIFSRRVVVTRHESVAQFCGQFQVPVLLHRLPHRSDTVRLGLKAIGSVDGCMFLPGDQPLLQRQSVASLALAAANDPRSIWRACHGDTAGAPVLFPAWTFEELMQLPQGKGGGVVIRKYPGHVRTAAVSDPLELADVDTPEDLAFLAKR